MRKDPDAVSPYPSPLGDILLAADDAGLTGLWFAGQKYFARSLDPACAEREVPAHGAEKRWLDVYFSGREPEFSPPLHLTGTGFQNEVWELLRAILYGRTATYGSWPGSWRCGGGCPACPPRPWAARWAATRSPSSSPATGWWGPTAV